MKKFLLFFFFSISLACAMAQPFGNEWVNPSRPHYRFTTNANAMYRISYAALSAKILNLSFVDPNSFVLYHNGQAVPIYVSSTGTTFGTNDYIEFRGYENDGQMDSLLYNSADDQINPDVSLFTDRATFYLAIEPLINHPRLTFANNNLQNLPPKEEYFMYDEKWHYLPQDRMYYPGQYYAVGQTETYKSTYDLAEGYADKSYGANSFTFNIFSIYTQGPPAILKINYTNNSNEDHKVFITLNGTQVYPASGTQNSAGFKFNRLEIPVSPSSLIYGVNTVTLTDIGNGNSSHKNVIGSVSIELPFIFNLVTQATTFELGPSAGNMYMEFTNFQDNGTQPLLYDITNGKIYRSVQPPGSNPVKFNIEPSVSKRSMVLRADLTTNIVAINSADITQVNFIDFANPANQAEYYIVTNQALLGEDGGGNYWVEEYRKYRNNHFNSARIADIETIYDQFGYGIRKSPLGLRNFINYMAKSGDIINKTKYVFLIGKGREAPSYRDTIYNIDDQADAYAQCLVPTFGYPGSDNLLAASRTSDTMCAAVGRLAANNVQQVRDYLDKVKKYEELQNASFNCAANPRLPQKEWQKQILHFSGGTSSSEQFMFRYYVDDFKKIAEDSLWGAKVTSFSKTSNNPIDVSLSQVIKSKINEGASWLTFFGHSATGAFDFSIDEPENYNNSPKFPIILSNGCFSGFIHDKDPGYSERFVLGADKGSIAFMATSSLSVSSALYNFSSRLYKNTCISNYNQPLGSSVRYAVRDLLTTNNINDYDKEVAYEMTLHGDPGIKPNQDPKPDFAIEASSVYTTPLTVDAGSDSFDVNIIVTNLGRSLIRTIDAAVDTARRDTILVTLKRTIFDANGNPVNYYYGKSMFAPFYKDTISFKIPVSISTLGYGQNLFDIMVEAAQVVDEMSECNNTLATPFTTYIQNDDIIPIYPYEFAIVPDKGVTLKASTINPFAPLRSYRIQIDTSETFSSADPLFRETVITQVGGVVHWTTDSLLYPNDSTVYYWRVRKDTAGATWHGSSFIYLKGEYPGWNQSHFYQYKKDNYQNINLDSADRIFKFPPNANNIHVRTGLVEFQNGPIEFETLGWDYNNYNEYRYRMGNCDGPGGSFVQYSSGLTFAVIDGQTGQPWVSHNYNGDDYGDAYGNIHCLKHSNDQYGFDFLTTGMHPDTNLSWSQVIANFINSIPQGNYILVYAVNQVPYTSWDNTLVQALSQIGFVSQPFTSGAINGPFVYFVENGNVNNPFNASQNGYSTALDVNITFNRSWFQGSFISPKIGPAVEWKSVHWRKQTLEGGPQADIDTLDIIGVRNDGSEVVLFRTGVGDNLYNSPGTDVLDATIYPYIRLRLNTYDNALRTPTQLYYWRVLYKKPPEAAINPAAVAQLNYTPNVTQGANFHLEIPLENVTEVPMDSMLTKYVVRDAFLNNVNFNIRYSPLPGLQTMMLVLDFPVTANNYLGLNRIIIEANPDNDQIEQYHFNNIAEINFNATGDKINPLLDVTFDNQHILNGDIISAKPNILITLKDENKFLALDTNELIDVYLKYPGATEPTKLVYDDVIMKFYPANAANLAVSNKAQVDLKPVFTVDGTYELLIKNRDRSGNNSATTDARFQGTPATFFDYKIAFEVITKATVTNVLNYPNPFTTSTKFVFTITGSEVPDVFKIQIMNIKGTVVKEIFKEELGNLHIGTNITEYAWDGRDQYGDLLANGIYFYHVATRLDDKEIEHRGMSYDKYFKKGFGKMAIIR